MSNLIDATETAASPYLFWIKLAGVVVLVAAIALGGWYGRGIYDQPKIDKAQLATQTCQTTREDDRANANGAAATGVQGSVNLATTENDQADTTISKLATQSQSIMEKVDALPNGNTLDGDPVLAAYLDGLRDSAGAAGK